MNAIDDVKRVAMFCVACLAPCEYGQEGGVVPVATEKRRPLLSAFKHADMAVLGSGPFGKPCLQTFVCAILRAWPMQAKR